MSITEAHTSDEERFILQLSFPSHNTGDLMNKRTIMIIDGIVIMLVLVMLAIILNGNKSTPNCASIAKQGHDFVNSHGPSVQNLIIAERLYQQYLDCARSQPTGE
jgi:hypothetical protein